MNLTMDENHVYRIDGRVVPSVTQIISEVMRPKMWGCTEWHMDRGAAVHACAAMIAQCIEFEHDDQIDGQVQAIYKWHAKNRPCEAMCELPVMHVSTAFCYAGTLDLVFKRKTGKVALLDWKGSFSGCEKWQLAAYAKAYEQQYGYKVSELIAVHTKEDGTYKETDKINIKMAMLEWQSICNVYAMKKREGIES